MHLKRNISDIHPMRLSQLKNKSLRVLQEEFNIQFPYLKIEFFKPALPGSRNKYQQAINLDRCLNEFQISNPITDLEINDKLTVSELEISIRKEYGISILVFRKSGSIWLETTATDGWTLESQNREGRELSLPGES
jgi:hypothetical protein